MSNVSESMLKQRLSIIISITTLLIPVLYLIGYFYHLGNLAGFETEIEFFPKTIQDYLVYSFLMFIRLVTGVFTYINDYFWVLVIYGVMLAIFGWYLTTNYSKKHKDFIETKTTSITSNKYYKNWSKPLTILVVVTTFPVVLTFTLTITVLIPFSSYWVGQAEANKVISKFNGCQVENSSCSYVYEGKQKILEGIFVAKSAEYIAIWNGTETVKYPLGQMTVISKKLIKNGTKESKKI